MPPEPVEARWDANARPQDSPWGATRPQPRSGGSRAHLDMQIAHRMARRTAPGSFAHISTTTASSSCGSPTQSRSCARVVLVSRPTLDSFRPAPARPLHGPRHPPWRVRFPPPQLVPLRSEVLLPHSVARASLRRTLGAPGSRASTIHDDESLPSRSSCGDDTSSSRAKPQKSRPVAIASTTGVRSRFWFVTWSASRPPGANRFS